MGRKVNPIGFRLGYVHGWQSNWFGGRNYTELLHEDVKIRDIVMRELQRAGARPPGARPAEPPRQP